MDQQISAETVRLDTRLDTRLDAYPADLEVRPADVPSSAPLVGAACGGRIPRAAGPGTSWTRR